MKDQSEDTLPMVIGGIAGWISGALIALLLQTAVVWAILYYLIGLNLTTMQVFGGILIFHFLRQSK